MAKLRQNKKEKQRLNEMKLLKTEIAKLNSKPCLLQDTVVRSNAIFDYDDNVLIHRTSIFVETMMARYEKAVREHLSDNKLRLARNVFWIKDKIVFFKNKEDSILTIPDTLLKSCLDNILHLQSKLIYVLIDRCSPDFKIKNMEDIFMIHKMLSGYMLVINEAISVSKISHSTDKADSMYRFPTYDFERDMERSVVVESIINRLRGQDGVRFLLDVFMDVVKDEMELGIEYLTEVDPLHIFVTKARELAIKSVKDSLESSINLISSPEFIVSPMVDYAMYRLMQFASFNLAGDEEAMGLIPIAAFLAEQTPLSTYTINNAGYETYQVERNDEHVPDHDKKIFDDIGTLNDIMSEKRRCPTAHMSNYDNEKIYCYNANRLILDNELVVDNSVSDVIIRFNPTSETVGKIYEARDREKNVRHKLTDIKMAMDFDMVMPRYSGSSIAIFTSTKSASFYGDHVHVEILDREQEDVFNNYMFDDNGECVCNNMTYEELYNDMWSMNKKVMVVTIPGIDGFMMFDNNLDIRVSTIATMANSYVRCPFVTAILCCMRTIIEYLNNEVDKGFVNINFIEHDYLKGTKRSYNCPNGRKGTVVRAHFRHYKSGVVTLVKPHIRRGTSVINGKIVLDIK